jgi:DNA topoisomerase IB
VLAAAVRLIDLGFFRPGGEEYAEENGTFGLATIRKEHVTVTKGQLVFEYTAKSARHREQAIAEDQVCAAVRSLKRRRGGGDQLLVYRSGPRWHHVSAADINSYLGEMVGGEYTASYIDPRVIELYQDGTTIESVLGDLGKDSQFGELATRGRAEAAVLKLLTPHLTARRGRRVTSHGAAGGLSQSAPAARG